MTGSECRILRRPWAAIALAVLGGTACGRFDPLDAVFPAGVPLLPVGVAGVDATTAPASAFPVFGGIENVLGESGAFRVGWSDGRDDLDPPVSLAYELYDAPVAGGQDFQAPLVATPPGTGSWRVAGLVDGTPHHLVVRVRDSDGDADRNQIEIPVLPAPVVYVDRTVTGPVQDGTTPATAFDTITEGLSLAQTLGGANLWVAEGIYEESLSLPDRVALYGGFDASFDPDGRDTQLHRTVIRGPAGASNVVDATIAGTLRILDGVVVEGTPSTKTGVRVEVGRLVLSNVTVMGTGGRGLRVRGPDLPGGLAATAVLVRTRVAYHAIAGVLLSGYASLDVVASRLDANGDGILADDLIADANGAATIRIVRSRIDGNLRRGIDVGYGGFGGGSSDRGRERVLVSNSVVDGNGSDGIRLDIDFDETGDDVRAQGILDHVVVRGNGGFGVSLDVDEPSLFDLIGVELFGNAGGGLFAAGENAPGVLRVAHGLVWANGSAGVRAEAPMHVGLLQDAVLWNRAEGVASDAMGAFVTGSILGGNVDDVAGLAATWSIVRDGEPGLGNQSLDPGFLRAPFGLTFAAGGGTAATVPLLDATSFFAGDAIEIDQDGVTRRATTFQGNVVTFDPPRAGTVPAGTPVATFGPGPGDVTEDLRLGPGSPGIDAGHPALRDPGGGAADVGPFGGPTAGALPGIDLGQDRYGFPFGLRELSTGFGGAIGSGDPVLFTLTEFVDPTTIHATSVAVVADGQAVPFDAEGVGPFVTVTPQGAIAPGAVVEIVLAPPLASDTGIPLAAPWIARFVAP